MYQTKKHHDILDKSIYLCPSCHHHNQRSSLPYLVQAKLATNISAPNQRIWPIALLSEYTQNKAPGHENITEKTIKKRSMTAVNYLVNVVNQLTYFLKTWNTSNITMIPKPLVTHTVGIVREAKSDSTPWIFLEAKKRQIRQKV